MKGEDKLVTRDAVTETIYDTLVLRMSPQTLQYRVRSLVAYGWRLLTFVSNDFRHVFF